MNKIHRVFFHELGHFVARELNLKYFNGTGSLEVKIYPCNQDPTEYCGHITPIRPNGVDENDNSPVPIERLAEHLASDLYGCIFQSHYLNTDLDNCTNCNGKDDIKKWIGSLAANNISFLNREIYPLSTEHLELLKSKKLLNNFMNLTPENYITETEENQYTVNLDKLRTDTSQIIEELYSYYKDFVMKHQEIINKSQSNK